MLYAIGLGWPTNGEAVIHSLASTAGSEHVQSLTLLGSDTKLQFDQRPDGLHVRMPAQAPAKYAYALRVIFATPCTRVARIASFRFRILHFTVTIITRTAFDRNEYFTSCSFGLEQTRCLWVQLDILVLAYFDSLMIASAALPATTQLADPATTASSSNHRNPKSSMHSGKSGLMMMYPGITAPGM